MVNNPLRTNHVFARNEGDRIAYYRIDSLDGADLWDDHWEKNSAADPKGYYRFSLQGRLGHGQLQHVFLKYLPKEGRILEAGCGRAQYVVALRARGYDCFGVDFAPMVVERVKRCLPDIPIERGDICRLNMGDEDIDAYVSLGVMEHFQDGPYTALKEAVRVLKKDGILIVSIPHAFAWRRLAAHPKGATLPDNASFYQYAFSVEEFRKILTDLNFQIKAEYGYASHHAFRLRFSTFLKLSNRFPQLSRIDLAMDRTPLGKKLSRMLLFVAKKNEALC